MRALKIHIPAVVFGEPMPLSFRREALVLLIGDIFFLICSLWATLLVRYEAFPDSHIFYTHLYPFSFLFLFSVAVFLIAGIYEKHTLLLKSKLPEMIFYAQIANVVIAAAFFFLVPYFGIQPKTNLFIYLFFSTTFVSAWRMYIFPYFAVSQPASALLVGKGEEFNDVLAEINGNTRYAVRFTETLDLSLDASLLIEKVTTVTRTKNISVIVLPFSLLRDSALLAKWDTLMLSGVKFVDSGTLYEDLFDRVSLPLIDERWFFDVQEDAPTILYAPIKRGTDIVLSALALIVLSPLVLLVALILTIQGGSAFIFQKRIGKDNRQIFIIKFRSMLYDDGEDPIKKKENRITAFGGFLRKTQIDEIPQFWNVLMGDLSLIGPRPEIPHFVEEYAKVIPHYEARHLIQPGLSGWAQIKHASPPKFKLDVEATRNKLTYDLYYLKHRSFLLDMEITLRTIKILLARASR